MNKNTITGLLLMGAIIMVFSYLNNPSKKAQPEKELTEEKDNGAKPASESFTAFSDEDRDNVISTIRTAGTLDPETNVYTLCGKDVVLTLTDDSVAVIDGVVNVGAVEIPAPVVINADYDKSITADMAKQAVDALNKTVENNVRYGGFARYMVGKDSTVTLANKDLCLTISSEGGVISQAELLDKRYNKYGGGQVCPIASGADMYGFTIVVGDLVYDTRDYYFDVRKESDTTVVATITPGDGVEFGFRYTLPREGYLVSMDLIQKNMSTIVRESKSSIEFGWNQKMTANEAGRTFESQNSAIYYMKCNGDVDNLSETGNDSENVKEPLEWIAYKNQFFSTVIFSRKGFDKAELSSKVYKDTKSPYLKEMSMNATVSYSSQLSEPVQFVFFIGPNSYPLLSDLQETIAPGKDLKLTKLVPLGWALFRWINTWIVIPVFTFLGKFISNYGIIILLLTVFIKILLFPFTYKSYMSQAKMRVLSPEIKEINEKYPGKENAMKRQQEMMALYSRAGASPMSGCLPMLLQLPILIAMFKFFPSAIELRGESFLWAPDLSAPDSIIPLPFSILFLGDRLSLFCLLMTAVNIIYTRINMQNQPGGMSSPAMKWMMYLMPVMFLFFFNNYAAGLSYYYLLSLLITIIQTYIFRKVVSEDKVRAIMKANAAKPKKKSGFMARLEEAQRKQQAMLREREKQRAKKNK